MVLTPAKRPAAPQTPPRRRARLLVVASPELPEGTEIDLGRDLVAGRDEPLDIPLGADGYASGRHARFAHGQDGDVVEDLHSTKGTFVNGDRVSRRRGLPSARLAARGPPAAEHLAGAWRSGSSVRAAP